MVGSGCHAPGHNLFALRAEQQQANGLSWRAERQGAGGSPMPSARIQAPADAKEAPSSALEPAPVPAPDPVQTEPSDATDDVPAKSTAFTCLQRGASKASKASKAVLPRQSTRESLRTRDSTCRDSTCRESKPSPGGSGGWKSPKWTQHVTRAFTRRKTQKLTVTKVFTLNVPLPGFSPDVISVTLDIDAPHKLSWDEDVHVTDGDARLDVDIAGDQHPALPKGACILYIFPTIMTADEPGGAQPSEAGLRALRKLIIAVATETGAFETADPVGAYPIHALMVCNTAASLEVSMDIYRKRPQLLTQVHAPSGPFRGESSLHICAVNRRERTLVELVHLAVEMLSPEEAEALIRGQTEGAFFTDTPMVHYGSTILAYACCFEMKVCMHAYMHAYMHTCIHAYMHAHMHTRMHIMGLIAYACCFSRRRTQ